MKKLISVLECLLFVAVILVFLFGTVMTASEQAFAGTKYIFGYSEETTGLFGTVTTTEYFNGKPFAGIFLLASCALGILASVLSIFTKKNVLRACFIVVFFAAIAGIAYLPFIAVNSTYFANYGSSMALAVTLGTEVTLGWAVWVSVGCLGAGALCAFGAILAK